MKDLRAALSGIPDAAPTDDLGAEIADSVRYLASGAALESLAIDTYWPKWNSPWWHMVLLHELGEARRIPERTVAALVDGLNALPIKIFPIRPEDAPGANRARDSSCHCALGNVDQLLGACGVDVDAALPWIRPWYPRYQMADGGMSCDETAYLVDGECPSSVTSTIAPFEAVLGAPPSSERKAFLDRAAAFFVARELRLGSPTVHNAGERAVAPIRMAPCFPRFYFYDVLRGLAALVRWAGSSGGEIPLRAVAVVVEHLVRSFPDGVVRLQRQATARCPTTWRQRPGGDEWARGPTDSFPLLEAASALGRPSAAATRQWAETRRGLLDLLDAARVVA